MNDTRDQGMVGLIAAAAMALIGFGMAALLNGCGSPESGTSAQVAAAPLGPEPGHTQMADDYTVARGPEEVCVVVLRSDCAPWAAWVTPPPSPAVPWRGSNRTPEPMITPCGGGT